MTIAVTVFTYNRFEYARRTVAAMAKNLQSSEPLALHIADDGSRDGDLDAFVAWCRKQKQWASVDSTNSERRGYGASFNLATQQTHQIADVHLLVEDDWELLRPLNLDQYVPILRKGLALVDCIRLGYLGWTQALRGELVRLDGIAFLKFDPWTPEPHVWTGHPRLETRTRQRTVGAWPEGVGAGTTEFAVAERSQSRYGVVWPMDIKPDGDLFAHIGTVQARDDQ